MRDVWGRNLYDIAIYSSVRRAAAQLSIFQPKNHDPVILFDRRSSFSGVLYI
jgi:hypothetical protein